MVTGFGDLPQLLYTAHRDLDTISLEIRDWSLQQASDTIVVQTGADGRARLRAVGAGFYPKPTVMFRRVWCELPDRLRVEVFQGERLVRTAVRDGGAWWRWDRDEGQSAGELAHGAALPAILDLVVLEPARLLATTWLEETGSSQRAGREVITAAGLPRRPPPGELARYEFEFDGEHGTPLRIAAFEGSERSNVTEVLRVDHRPSFDDGTFSFELHPAGDGQHLDAGPERRGERVRQTPAAVQRNRVSTTPRGAFLVDHATVWLTGTAGAGNTVIARAVERLLHQLGVPCCVLDGDELRDGLSGDLGCSREDLGEQARRVAHIATILADSGIVPVVALDTAHAEDRQRAREIHQAAAVRFLEVWVDAPLESGADRDTDALYTTAEPLPNVSAQADDGSGVAGLIALYQPPESPDVRVGGEGQHPRTAAISIVEQLLATRARTHVLE